jgi:hypothetical protein
MSNISALLRRPILKLLVTALIGFGVAWSAYRIIRPPATPDWKLDPIGAAVLGLAFVLGKDLAALLADWMGQAATRNQTRAMLRATAQALKHSTEAFVLPLQLLTAPTLDVLLLGATIPSDPRLVHVFNLRRCVEKSGLTYDGSILDLLPRVRTDLAIAIEGVLNNS